LPRIRRQPQATALVSQSEAPHFRATRAADPLSKDTPGQNRARGNGHAADLGWTEELPRPLIRRFPGTVITGQATFEWLEDQRFLIERSHYDHPEIPDAIAVTGIIDGKPSMHYFDPRGVHRVFAVDITPDTWRFWNDAPGFSQRFTGTLSDDGNAINGVVELSRDDGATWEPDLAITYRRTG
jgi:hypothetical protein